MMPAAGDRTIKVRILRACFAGGVVRRVGELVEVPADEAFEAFGAGKAEPANPACIGSKQRVGWELEQDRRTLERAGWLFRDE